MPTHAARTAALVLLFAAAFAPAAPAGEDGGSSGYTLSARIRWWIAQTDGSFQVNQKDARGSFEDYRDDLDLEAYDPRNNPGVPDLSLEGRLGNMSLILGWVESSLSGDSWVDRMDFHGKTYVAEHIRTDLDLRYYRATFGYALLDGPMLSAGIQAGIGYIDYRISVEPDPLSPTGPTHTGGNAPFPYFGGRGTLRPASWVEFLAEFAFSRGDWGDARLFFADGAVSVALRPVRFVSLGLGFRLFHLYADRINVWSESPDTLLLTLGGPYLELEGRF
jgi:hypothetical protein